MEIHLPYGKGRLTAHIPDSRQIQVLRGRHTAVSQSPSEVIEAALDRPYGGRKLSELAAGKRNAVIIASDHTRPVPSKWLMPLLLRELYAGNPEISVTILIAAGCHRTMTQEELTQKFGAELLRQVTVIQHRSDDSVAMEEIGVLPSGRRLAVNRIAVQADLLLAEGFIEPHFFAGFSGGRKSVLPGISSVETILENHSADMIDNPHARSGVLDGNPIHLDMQAAADMAGLAFICNVILNEEKQIMAAVAGEPAPAHRAGCELVAQMMGAEGVFTSIVITTNGGYPLDQNLYQCVKGITTAAQICLPGGVIILCAECVDGHGGEKFYQALSTCTSISALLEEIRGTAPSGTKRDQWQYQILARILEKYHVILVTRPVLEPLVRKMHMEYAPDIPTALTLADTLTGGNSAVTVIPDGVGTIVLPKQGVQL